MAPKGQQSTHDEHASHVAPTAGETADTGTGATHNGSKFMSNGTTQSSSTQDQTSKPVEQDTTENTTKISTVTLTNTNDGMAISAHYGTRSRNRGQARPNYAEDRDMDIDMLDAYEKREEEPKRTARQVAASAAQGSLDAPRPGGAGSRKAISSTDDSKTGNLQVAPKIQPAAPSTSHTNSATSTNTTGISKKRKAPGAQAATSGSSHSTTTATTQQSGSAPAAGASSKSSGVVASSSESDNGNAVIPPGYKESNMLTFEGCGAMLTKDGKLVADDGTVVGKNDHVYLVCEPPGEPYYLGRIMEFLHVQNEASKPVDALRVNWYYRPKDIGKKINDTRHIFASMHSDINPLTALRGRCQIFHRAEVGDNRAFEEYRRKPDCFWFDKLYDRYIQKHYDVIPCSQIVNVPENVKKVLDERWKFLLIEQGRSKDYTSAVKLCKRCSGFCHNNDSVDCAVCQQTYHMNCVRPPLLKKPSRGFAWACAACSRAQERKLEARNTPNLNGIHPEVEEEEFWEDEEEDRGADTNGTNSTHGIDDTHKSATAEQIYQASLWPWRYLGIHCKPEDALDYDDRIYPRAGSRLGLKHQANVMEWPGRPLQLVKPLEIKKTGRKDGRLNKETLAMIEADKIAREKRPKWIQDEPNGYVARGEDYPSDDPRNTAQLLWKPTEAVDASITAQEIDKFLEEDAMSLAPTLGLPKRSTNLQDVACHILYKNNYDTSKTLKMIARFEKSIFKEPELSAAELKKFEEAVSKFGSELHHVTKYVKTVKHGDIVRFWYTWKKTARGQQIWGSFPERKGKKEAKKAEATANKIQDDVADDRDDSALDPAKAAQRKRKFCCKFCNSKSSRQWRKAPSSSTNTAAETTGKNKDKNAQYIMALCQRCAELWRRYAVHWEDIDELNKKVIAAGGRAWKKKVDEELLREISAANEMMNATVYKTPSSSSTPAPPTVAPLVAESQPRKKLKTMADKEAESAASDSTSTPGGTSTKKKEKDKEKGKEKEKEKEKEKVVETPPPPPPPPPPPAPEPPKSKVLPCTICGQLNPTGEQHLLACKECRLHVHRKCYGVLDNRQSGKWTCDTCQNDKNPQASLEYKCVLCPVEYTAHDFVIQPKVSHKKKTEKEREKERQDRDNANKAAEYFRKRQEEMNRPVNPREPLKRTADNNWVHVTCAVWTPEVRFGNAKTLSPSEGIPLIPRARYGEQCKACKHRGGACIPCHQCRTPVHVECARQHGWHLGFEISPVKGSRRDQHHVVSINGEIGTMSAVVWCKEHHPHRSSFHQMFKDATKTEPSDGPTKHTHALTALQLYAQTYKQADESLTGTVRKANLIAMATKTSAPITPVSTARRASTVAVPPVNAAPQTTASIDTETAPSADAVEDTICISCGVDASPRWWPVDKSQQKVLTNGHSENLGGEAQKFVDQRCFQCHKCKKIGRQPIPHEPPEPECPVSDVTPYMAALAVPSHTFGEQRLENAQSVPCPRIDSFDYPLPAHSVPGPNGQQNSLHAAVAVMQATPSDLPTSRLPSVSCPGPNSIGAPPPPISHPFVPPSGPTYGDWHLVAAHQSPPPRHNSMHHTGPAPMNQLRELRPPPIAPINQYQPGLPHNIAGSPPIINGIPPSPGHLQHITNGTVPYYSAHQPQPSSQQSHSLLHLTNGAPPPRVANNTYPQGPHAQRPHMTTPHVSPPVSRDGPVSNREPSMGPNNHASRPSDGRLGGASASPSLRNLVD